MTLPSFSPPKYIIYFVGFILGIAVLCFSLGLYNDHLILTGLPALQAGVPSLDWELAGVTALIPATIIIAMDIILPEETQKTGS